VRSIAGVFAVFIPLASLSGAQLIREPEPVQVAYDRERDFSRFRTYAWMKSQKPLPNLANHIRLTNAVQKELKKLGFLPNTQSPDVYVLYSADNHAKVEFDSFLSRSKWDAASQVTNLELRRTEQRSLSVMLIDPETNGVIWYAQETHDSLTADKVEQEINDAAARVFGKYPTKKPDSPTKD